LRSAGVVGRNRKQDLFARPQTACKIMFHFPGGTHYGLRASGFR
jgi:hypothetical protein